MDQVGGRTNVNLSLVSPFSRRQRGTVVEQSNEGLLQTEISQKSNGRATRRRGRLSPDNFIAIEQGLIGGPPKAVVENENIRPRQSTNFNLSGRRLADDADAGTAAATSDEGAAAATAASKSDDGAAKSEPEKKAEKLPTAAADANFVSAPEGLQAYDCELWAKQSKISPASGSCALTTAITGGLDGCLCKVRLQKAPYPVGFGFF